MRTLRWFLALLFTPTLVWAQGVNLSTELQNTLSKSGDLSPQVNVSLMKMRGKSTGLFIWSLVSNEWAESIVGGVWVPTQSVELDLGAGVESDAKPLRGLATLVVNHKRMSLLNSVEYGGSGFWYMAVGNYSFTPSFEVSDIVVTTKFGVGFRAQRFVGIGPRLEGGVGDGVTLWVMPWSRDPENSRARNIQFGLSVRL